MYGNIQQENVLITILTYIYFTFAWFKTTINSSYIRFDKTEFKGLYRLREMVFVF